MAYPAFSHVLIHAHMIKYQVTFFTPGTDYSRISYFENLTSDSNLGGSRNLSLRILDDRIVEGREHFNLVSSDSSVQFRVAIEDNDGNWNLLKGCDKHLAPPRPVFVTTMEDLYDHRVNNFICSVQTFNAWLST